jgi:pimeloyl-ACP methyl ester carboxylesterase
MHQAISAKTFDLLQQVPGLTMPASLVRGAHDAISHGVYAAVRQGGAAALSLAGLAERLATDPLRPIVGTELSVRSALNGVFGDTLTRSGSALAVSMGFHADGAPLELTREALAGLKQRVVVFIHGLACDEQSWLQESQAWDESEWASALPSSEDIHYGALLARELDLSSIYVRYNTGVAIDANARELTTQLEDLVHAAPARLRELVLIGHSMGGLVARGACDEALRQGLSWRQRCSLLICLGTPHQGSRLEQLGHLTGAALNVSAVTRPLGRIANARSQGIKDLRHGRRGKAGLSDIQTDVPLRLVVGGLAGESAGPVSKVMGKLLGDGLVSRHSAADDGLTGDVQRVELPGLGHMALLNHPRVYAALRSWLTAGN